jgi:hypothetical protein
MSATTAPTGYLRVAKPANHAVMDASDLAWLAHWCVTDGNINDHAFVEGWANDLTPDGFDLFMASVKVECPELFGPNVMLWTGPIK